MRVNHGLTALRIDATLCRLAYVRACEASINWSHTRPDGRYCFTVFTDYNVPSGTHRGEILGRGRNLTASRLVDAWMNSEAHSAEILKTDFTTAGIASYTDTDGVTYVAVLFTNR